MTAKSGWSFPEITLLVGAIRLAAIVIFGLILTWLPAYSSHFSAGAAQVTEQAARDAQRDT
jgi:hypothetical protein